MASGRLGQSAPAPAPTPATSDGAGAPAPPGGMGAMGRGWVGKGGGAGAFPRSGPVPVRGPAEQQRSRVRHRPFIEQPGVNGAGEAQSQSRGPGPSRLSRRTKRARRVPGGLGPGRPPGGSSAAPRAQGCWGGGWGLPRRGAGELRGS